MKNIVSYFMMMTACFSARGQTSSKRNITGSWVNQGVTNFYKTNRQSVCDIEYFRNNNKLLPLYLSFENEHQVKITYRIEQRIFTCEVKNLKYNSIIVYKGKSMYKISFSNNILKLRLNQETITFEKVSDNYSNDVFGEFIKDLIFKNNKYYSVDFFKDNKYNNLVISKINLKNKIKQMFKCDYVDFVPLSPFEFNNICLPKIALYYNNEKDGIGPQIFGIVLENNKLKLIDSLGANVLILKSN